MAIDQGIKFPLRCTPQRSKFFARGYEPQYIKMKTAEERHRVLNVQLVPKNAGSLAQGNSPK